MKVKSLSQVPLFAAPWTAAYQAPSPMGFSRQEYWSGVPLPSPIIYIYTQIYTMGYYSAIKMNEIIPILDDLEIIILSEVKSDR